MNCCEWAQQSIDKSSAHTLSNALNGLTNQIDHSKLAVECFVQLPGLCFAHLDREVIMLPSTTSPERSLRLRVLCTVRKQQQSEQSLRTVRYTEVPHCACLTSVKPL